MTNFSFQNGEFRAASEVSWFLSCLWHHKYGLKKKTKNINTTCTNVTQFGILPESSYTYCQRCLGLKVRLVFSQNTWLWLQHSGPSLQAKILTLVSAFRAWPSLRVLCLNYHHCFSFWPTVLSVEPMVQCVVCRLSVVCLSVCLSSVTFCIVAKWCVVAKKCLKEWIGNQGQKVHFLGRRHISTSGFAATATQTAVLPYFCPYSPAIDTRW